MSKLSKKKAEALLQEISAADQALSSSLQSLKQQVNPATQAQKLAKKPFALLALSTTGIAVGALLSLKYKKRGSQKTKSSSVKTKNKKQKSQSASSSSKQQTLRLGKIASSATWQIAKPVLISMAKNRLSPKI